WREIVDLFTGAHKTRWNSQFILNWDDDAPLAATVELGDNETGQSDCALEFARLTERIAASGSIDYHQRLMRRVWVLFAKSAFPLLQLGHQVFFCLHSAGRVAQEKLNAPFRRRLIRFVAKGSRVAIVLAADHFNAEAFGPNTKLFDRCAPKSVCRRQQYAMSVFLKVTSQLRCRCCLSRAVYSQEQNHLRFCGEWLNGCRIGW